MRLKARESLENTALAATAVDVPPEGWGVNRRVG